MLGLINYYTQDYLGNNRAVINGSTGAIEQTTAYYPCGGVIADLGTGNSGQPFKFGGKEFEKQVAKQMGAACYCGWLHTYKKTMQLPSQATACQFFHNSILN